MCERACVHAPCISGGWCGARDSQARQGARLHLIEACVVGQVFGSGCSCVLYCIRKQALSELCCLSGVWDCRRPAVAGVLSLQVAVRCVCVCVVCVSWLRTATQPPQLRSLGHSKSGAAAGAASLSTLQCLGAGHCFAFMARVRVALALSGGLLAVERNQGAGARAFVPGEQWRVAAKACRQAPSARHWVRAVGQ